jgi:hypothetical protein
VLVWLLLHGNLLRIVHGNTNILYYENSTFWGNDLWLTFSIVSVQSSWLMQQRSHFSYGNT